MNEEKKKVSKAQQRSVNKYVKNNYGRIGVTFPKGERELIQKAAAAAGVPFFLSCCPVRLFYSFLW